MSVRRLVWFSAVGLAACSAVSLLLLDHRLEATWAYPVGFLRWNLALAWVPFAASVGAYAARGLSRPAARLTLVGLGAIWLLFLPNAPYVVTDAVHLDQPGVVLPFDALLIGGFAVTALGLGVVSLRLMHDAVREVFSPAAGWMATLAATASCGIGVWIGRVWRWNSWDVFDAPSARARTVAGALVHNPDQYARSATLAAGVALVFLVSYLLLFAVTPSERRP